MGLVIAGAATVAAADPNVKPDWAWDSVPKEPKPDDDEEPKADGAVEEAPNWNDMADG
ncbi:MAG: hypothetical protein P4M09_21050 [Devosia sp.]|nr:hypothetical protein [Devosia sp.]